jgi:hypothetical protein
LFAWLRFRREWPFLFGRQPYIRSLPKITTRNGMSLWQISVTCVKGMESPWTIFFIVRLLVPFGMFSSSWVMPIQVVNLYACWSTTGNTQRVLQCERWCLCAFCSVYEGKWMTKILKTVRGLWRRLNLYFILF